MFDKIIKWSLNNRLLVIVAYIVFLVVGVFIVQKMTVDVFPEFAPPQVVVQTESPGLSPEDVEKLITFPIESAVNGTPNVEAVRSKSSVGLSTVVVVFRWGTNIYTARQMVNERLQLAQGNFPPGTKPPVMLPVTSAVSWLIKYALTSETLSPLDLRTLSDWEIRNRLLAIPGVASVVSIGGGVKQYQVLISLEKLFHYNLTVADVVSAASRANVNVPAGFIVTGGQEYIVTGIGRLRSLDDLKNTVVTERKGTPIKIGDLAEVRFGPEAPRGDASYNGKPAVIGTVSKAFGTDTLTVTYQVEQALKEIQKTLPKGIKLQTEIFRQANFIESSIRNLKEALAEGTLIVTIVILFFLFNVRASFISLTAIPTSLIFGVMVLEYMGIGINAMTLGGMAVAIGEVVDDAVIDVENVFRRLRENRQKQPPTPPLQVVFYASKEIRDSVIYARDSVVYATLIVLIVFVPIFLLSGVEGRIFSPLGIAYIASVGSSLLVALTLTPVLCYLLLAKKRGDDESAQDKESLTIRWLKSGYEKILRGALARPRWVMAVSIALLIAAIATIPFFGRSFLPEFHEGNFILAVSTLPGTSLDESMRLGGKITEALQKYPEVVSIAQRAGRSELDEDAAPPNFSEFDITLKYGKRPPEELVEAIRGDMEKIPGVAINLGQFIAHRLDEVLSGVRAQIAIKIFGPDLKVLREKGKRVQKVLEGIKGVTDLQLEQQMDVPEIRINIDRARAARLGLNIEDVAQTVQVAFNGAPVSRVLEGQKTFDLVVWFDERSRANMESMKGILIDTPGRGKIPLSAIADVQIENRPYFINREQIQRRIVVQSNVAGRDLGSVIEEAKAKIQKEVVLPQGYFIEYGGQFQSQQEATRILTSYGIFAIFGIFLLLYKAFNSVRSSLFVMVNLPLAMIGGIFAIFLTDRDLSIASLIGFIALFGIAVRNGIILISHYRQLRTEGKSKEEVVVEGSKDRLAPVLMTAATAALGLLPLVMGEITGKELERPLAHVILGGLFTSTFLNLIVVPVLFMRYGWEKEEGVSEDVVLDEP